MNRQKRQWPRAGAGLQRLGWQALACLCIGVGALGVVLPLLPTTPFLLLAAFAASRSSPALERWLHTHPRLGPPLENWRRNRAIEPRAKRVAIALIAASWLLTIATVPSVIVRLAVTLMLAAVVAFIATRPAGPSAG